MVKNPVPVKEMQETWVESLGQEDPLEQDMGTPCLENPMDRGARWATVHGWGYKKSDMIDQLAHTQHHTHLGLLSLLLKRNCIY